MCSWWRTLAALGLLTLAPGAMAGDARDYLPLGTLEPFWRYSAALGPFLEGGQGLSAVPEFMLRGDFAYRKRPFPKEVLFADYLSVVRILGGYDDGSGQGAGDPAVRDRDLAYRAADGKIRYRMNLLRPRLQPLVSNGYGELTIVLDNVPWCFPEKPHVGSLGQVAPPRDPREWQAFIEAFCRELAAMLGREKAGRLRFRVGTENNSRRRFDGSQQQYFRHYDATAAAVRAVLPEAKVGCYNISGVTASAVRQTQNVRSIALAEHCFREPNSADGRCPTPFDWVAYSRYFRAGDDPLVHGCICREVWEEFEQAVPQLKGVSREVQEFGVAPPGEAVGGVFASAEPGALGAALTCQMMLRLREAGVGCLWHWSVLDRFRDSHHRLIEFPTGQAWLLSVLEQMRGGKAMLLFALEPSPQGTSHLGLGCLLRGNVLLLISAYNAKIVDHTPESVGFRLPPELGNLTGKRVSLVRLDRRWSVHDRIRRDLEEQQLLSAEFLRRPDRLGTVREMIADQAGEHAVGDNCGRYAEQWEESLTLKAFDRASGSIRQEGAASILTVRLAPPELLVLQIR